MGNLDDRGSARPGLLPDGDGDQADADVEWSEYVAWLDREAAAGRGGPEPAPWLLDDGEPWGAEHTEPDLTAPVPIGPAPAGPAPAGPGKRLFAEDGAGDLMPPVPFLAALTEQAARDMSYLSDNELVGVLRASRRQVAREQYKQALAAAEFARRRHAAFEGALAHGIPAGCAAGGFPGAELSIELLVTRAEAGRLIDDAIDLTSRLPCTLAGMAAGLIDDERAGWIAYYTRSLTPADAALADEILAGAAPELRAEQLARKAAALEMRLNPDAVRERRQRAKQDEQRVEARRETSGNASLSGRELDTADVLASKAYLDAIAARLRACGLGGSLDRLRALALTDLTQGRDPLSRVNPAPPAGQDDDLSGRPGGTSAPAPVPALVNLLLPAATLLGLSTTPAQAGAWGLLDADSSRTLAAAAAAHPATRWCLTLTGPDGTALAHGCARGPRPRLLDDLEPQPPPARLAELLRRLNITLTPIAQGDCDHAHAEKDYVPSRKLRHLVRARTATCDAPGCHNPAAAADLDHTVPWPAGPTDQCNLAPRCRTHHRAKQAPDWTVKQTAPGVTRWTMPSGRTHLTTPTKYDI